MRKFVMGIILSFCTFSVAGAQLPDVVCKQGRENLEGVLAIYCLQSDDQICKVKDRTEVQNLFDQLCHQETKHSGDKRHGRDHNRRDRQHGSKNFSADKLYTIYGVTLGKTTVSELKRWGAERKKTSRHSNSYLVYREVDFWHYDGDVLNTIYVTQGASKEDLDIELPSDLIDQGLSFYLSYNQAMSFLLRTGFDVEVTERPHHEYFKHVRGYKKGGQAFTARIEGKAYAQDGRLLIIELVFSYNAGNEDSVGTLYGIWMKID